MGLLEWEGAVLPSRAYGVQGEDAAEKAFLPPELAALRPCSVRDPEGGVVLQPRPHVVFSGLTRNKKNRVCGSLHRKLFVVSLFPSRPWTS